MPHTAHSDHLVRDVGEGEVLEEAPSIGLEGVLIDAEQVADMLEKRIDVEPGQLVDRDDQRRVADDPPPPVDDGGQLPDRLQAVASVRLRERGLRSLQPALLFFSSRAVSVALYSARASSMLRCAYQTARMVWPAKVRIAVR